MVAENSWAAMRGCKALDCQWERDGGVEQRAARANLPRPVGPSRHTGPERRRRGEGARAWPTRSSKPTYEVPFLAHATMEPMNCAADVRAGRCDVYAPTQCPTMVRQVAERLDRTGRVVHRRPHDAHGRRVRAPRCEVDWVIDAIRVSKALSRPIQVVWTREHDMQHDNYRPASYHVLRGGLDASGRIVAWIASGGGAVGHRLARAERAHRRARPPRRGRRSTARPTWRTRSRTCGWITAR